MSNQLSKMELINSHHDNTCWVGITEIPSNANTTRLWVKETDCLFLIFRNKYMTLAVQQPVDFHNRPAPVPIGFHQIFDFFLGLL